LRLFDSIYMYIYISIYVYLSIYLSMYIYIYIDRNFISGVGKKDYGSLKCPGCDTESLNLREAKR
jgi:hypothetical protein